MPFLHWFKSKSESTEAEAKPVLADKLATEQANTPETVVSQFDKKPDRRRCWMSSYRPIPSPSRKTR